MLFYLRDQRMQLVQKGNAIWSGKLAGGKASGPCQISINHMSPNYGKRYTIISDLSFTKRPPAAVILEDQNSK